ncbi:AMP-binding protein [Umezawaea sp. Da 62-37]|uniref:AMP-binding protein n=1 Tax=Umezawaea sp. Da 62-37 TaxID=3075927 RepID=UPI0028F6CC54|nr:AMP-binding protein [Umezawaea sp. Da 62-37]WNV85794.1 AMP-binding protein [Umezawaea sp. Da 62-37]
MLPRDRRARMRWGRTLRDDRVERALFEAAAPDAVALAVEDDSVTYRDLNARANRLAHHLIGLGVGPGDVVAVVCGRTVDGVAGLLAVLKTGADFLSVDVELPLARIAAMLGDTRPKATLATRVTAGFLGSAVGTCVVVDRPDTARTIDGRSDLDPTDADRVRPLPPAPMPGGAVAGHVWSAGAGRRVRLFTSPMAEVVAALASGAALVLAPAVTGGPADQSRRPVNSASTSDADTGSRSPKVPSSTPT